VAAGPHGRAREAEIHVGMVVGGVGLVETAGG
jgi:hypothetical protein